MDTELELRIKAKIPGEDTGIQIKKSMCSICSPGNHCGLDVYVKDGKILKSSSVYIRDESGKVSGILGINYDISMMQLFENSLHDFISADQHASREPERITLNVADLLDDLIRQADELVGKPVALMTKDDKVKAIRYLSNSGALLITKSGDKIAKHFGISKYTLYSYLDNSKTGGTNEL